MIVAWIGLICLVTAVLLAWRRPRSYNFVKASLALLGAVCFVLTQW